MKTGLALLLSGIIFNTIILIASISSGANINSFTPSTQVPPNSISSTSDTSELDSFKKEIFSKQREIQALNEDIEVLGDLIKGLEQRHRGEEQIKQRMFLLKKKMNGHVKKLILLEDELKNLQAWFNAKQTQSEKDKNENWEESEKESKYKDNDDDYDSNSDKYSKADIKSTKKVNGYYVQVGSWKNYNYAQEMLDKIINYYPEAYIVEHNHFKKIRIPIGVLYNKQGLIVTKDIEEKFNIKPLLVQKL